MYAPTMYHRFSPVTTFQTITFGPHFYTTSTAKRGVVEKCGPNVMAWQVVTGEKRWYFVGAYIAPADEGTMELVVKAIVDMEFEIVK